MTFAPLVHVRVPRVQVVQVDFENVCGDLETYRMFPPRCCVIWKEKEWHYRNFQRREVHWETEAIVLDFRGNLDPFL
jgi:hypothetical protein